MRTLFFTTALTVLLALILSCSGIPSTGSGATAGSPTDAYKTLYAAVKSKDTEKIKAAMSKKTQEFAQMVAARNNSPIEKVFENGFTATTFAESLPEIRDERISGDFGGVEVWNAKDNRWEDLGFIREAAVSFKAGGDAKAKAQEATKDLKGLKVTETGDGVQVDGALLSSEAANLRSRMAEAGVDVRVDEHGWKLAIGEMFAGTFKSPGKGRAIKEQEAANMANGNNMVPIMPANSNANANVKVIVPKERPLPPSTNRPPSNNNK